MIFQKTFALLLSLMIFPVFGQNFSEDNPKILLNKIVKPKTTFSAEILQKHAFLQKDAYSEHFFLKFDIEKKQFIKDDEKSLILDYRKLVGKEFKVLEIFEIPSEYSFSDKNFSLKLENPEIGIIYYKYKTKYEGDFELEVVGGINYPEGFFCSKIEYKKDKFEHKETYYTPAEMGVNYMKTVENWVSDIYLRVINNSGALSFKYR
jgi:hypothetical protein